MPRRESPTIAFLRRMDEAFVCYETEYRGEHVAGDPRVVDAYMDGFKEAYGMWIAAMVMRAEGRGERV